MSQFDFGDLNSPLSGAQLCNDVIEPWRDAVNSMHSGATRPSYVVPQMMWIDTSATPWVVKVFQGSDDIIMGNLDPSTLLFTPSAVDGGGVTGVLASNVTATDPNSTGETDAQGQLNYATLNATQVQAEAGTDNNARMTALRTRQSIERFGYIPVSSFTNISNPNTISSFTMPYDGLVNVIAVTTAPASGGYVGLTMFANNFTAQSNTPFGGGNNIVVSFLAPAGSLIANITKFQADINVIRVFRLKKDI